MQGYQGNGSHYGDQIAKMAAGQTLNSSNSNQATTQSLLDARVKPSTVQGDLSPIMERLSHLLDEISHAHSNMSELERRLTPVRAVAPPGDGEESALIAGPSEIEDRLTMAYNHLRGLNARITALRSELRI